MSKRATIRGLLAACLCVMGAASVSAQDGFPSKPITVIVPYSAGGVTDLYIRAMTPKMSEILGQPVVVDNRGGGGTIIGTQLASRAAPDGYTILLTSYAYTSNPILRKSMPYEPSSLTPLMLLGNSNNMLLMTSKSKSTTVQEVVAYAKSAPGQLKVASSGNASSPHIAAELFAKTIGAEITHLPYKGTGPAMTDVISGQVDGIFDGVSSMPHVEAGRLRPIAIAAEERHPMAPNVPTFREKGVDLVFGSWFGFLLPAGVPAPIQAKLSDAMRKTLEDPEIREKIVKTGIRLKAGTPQEFAQFLKVESDRLQGLIDSGAKIEVE